MLYQLNYTRYNIKLILITLLIYKIIINSNNINIYLNLFFYYSFNKLNNKIKSKNTNNKINSKNINIYLNLFFLLLF